MLSRHFAKHEFRPTATWRLALAILAGTVLAPVASQAQYSWVNSANQTGNWNAAARWTGGAAGTFPNAADATATLNQPLSTAPSGNYNVQLSNTAGQTITVQGITVNNFVGANDTANLRIGANGNGNLVFQSNSGPAFYTENAAPGVENTSAGITNIFAPVTFLSDTVITQNHALNNNNGTSFTSTANSPGGTTAAPGITLTKAGGGNVEFNVPPSGPGTGFQGSVVVNGGAVRDTANVFQNAEAVTVNGGGQYQLASATVTDWSLGSGATLNLNGTGKGTGVNATGALRTQNTTAVANFNNPVNLQSDATIAVNGAAAKLTLTQTVSGAGSLTKADDGTLVLAGSSANTFANARAQAGTLLLNKPDGVTAIPGNLSVQNPTGTSQATVVWGANNQVADSSIVTVQQSTGTGTPNGVVSLNGFSDTIGGLNSTAGAGIVQNGGATPSTLGIAPTAAASSFTGVIQDGGIGAFALNVAGSQPVSLTGANTYSGGTTVSGTLLADNLTGSATGTGSVSVTAGGTLGGSGFIAGDVGLISALLAPGDSPGTLTVGNLSIDSNSALSYQLGLAGVVGSGINDLTEVNGNLSLAGTLSVLPVDGFGAGVYRLFDYTGELSYGGLNIFGLPVGYSGQIDVSIPGQVNLAITGVPEPSSLALAGAGALALAVYVQMRRRAARVL